MNVSAFRDSPTGRIVPVANGWAFVPRPLPPRLVMDTALERQLDAAGRALGELARMVDSLTDPHLLMSPFIRREAAFSCRLAGHPVNLTDLCACRADGQEFAAWALTGNEDEVRQALRLADTLEWAQQHSSNTEVSLRFIRELHARAVGRDIGGSFRHTLTWIGAPGSDLADADYVPPPPAELQPALRHLETYLATAADQPFHSLVRLALAYYQFDAIHPFLDGNGLVNCLLLTLLPGRWGLLPHPILTMSAYFLAAKQDHDRLLLTVSSEGDWRSWVLYFLRGVEGQARAGLRRLSSLHQAHQASYRRLEQPVADGGAVRSDHGRSLALQHRLPDRLLETPILSVSGLQSILSVNRLNAERSVEYLVAAGVLAPFAPAPGRPAGNEPTPALYAATDLLKAMVL